MPPATIRSAVPDDLAAIQSLLTQAKLPFEDVGKHLGNFLVAREEGHIVGAVGFEYYGTDAFIRSFVVEERLRNHGLGKRLYDAAIERARSKGILRIGLLTDTAERFFAREGFVKVPREVIPEFIKSTTEYRIYCPSSSTCMVKQL